MAPMKRMAPSSLHRLCQSPLRWPCLSTAAWAIRRAMALLSAVGKWSKTNVALNITPGDMIGQTITCAHPVMRWLVAHQAYPFTKYHVGSDNATGHMRMHGRCPLEKLADTGERVLWYVPKKRRAKLEPGWRNGLCWGACLE